ncbi:MAG: redox-regulated ATPase YchF [Kiritimatiellae bacterium]|nr:redox-regulated ATPase YchF [Kiritimatiellia bacterium]
MALMLYLVGPRAGGKTSVFDALATTPEGLHCATKGAHRLDTVKVPDARLTALRDLFQPKKFIPAEVTFVDVALPTSTKSQSSYAPLNAFLGEADAFALVIPTFPTANDDGTPAQPASLLESTLLDLAMADLEKIERRLEKIDQELRRGQKQALPERAVLQKCKDAIEAGSAIRSIGLTPDETKLIASFCFLSQKPVLVVANTPDSDPDGKETAAALSEACKAQNLPLLAFCAPLEAEIAALPAADQPAFLADYGLAEPARERLIQAAYRTLKLISFFTVGPDEVRAWTIHEGDDAVTAAGKIHSDLARGFIRAETVPSTILLEHKTHAACRELGLLRLEGKAYVVQDGDVIEIRANA